MILKSVSGAGVGASAATNTMPNPACGFISRVSAQRVLIAEHDAAADDGHDGLDAAKAFVRYRLRIEGVGTEDDEIGEAPGFDRSQRILLAREPAVRTGIEVHGLLPRDLLAVVDQLAKHVLAGDHVVDVQPRVDWCRLCAVEPRAHVDAAVEEAAILRAGGTRRAGKHAPAVRANAHTQFLHALDRR